MSQQELNRLSVIKKVESKQLAQVQGAKLLGLSIRQVRNLQYAYRQVGAKGLISKRRGQPSNHQIDKALRERAMGLIQAYYPDFGPVLACEKLKENHELSLSKETIRQLMIANGLWQPKRRKSYTIHPCRTRRSQRGEWIQIDGSPHDWFEGRAKPCCLLVFIDDATSELMPLHFCEAESTQAYFDAIESYLALYGKPCTLYSDRHSIFRVNHLEARSGTGDTQFSRAMKALDVELICAHSPQAKGRVERANQTLQDRLVKQMRLHNISGIEAGNAFVPTYINAHNKRFAVAPTCPIDAHRHSLPSKQELNDILSHHSLRKVSKNLEISYQNVIYQIQANTPRYTLRQATLTVCDQRGKVSLLYKNERLAYQTMNQKNQPTQIVTAKQLPLMKKSTAHKPAANHPWRNKQLFINNQTNSPAL